ncbi:MAG: DegT/DnrJ/EryC1/StrS family aminotransferase, partial [bacterium]
IGMPADIDSFRELCEKHSLKLIEDAACAAGSVYKGNKIGSHSGLVCFSFHPRKVITTGEGGMITTSNEEYYSRLKLLRQHGMRFNSRERHTAAQVISEEHAEIGYNYRMTDFQGAIGIRQLEKLDYIIDERRKIALKYIDELGEIKCLRMPVEHEGFISNYQSFSIYLKEDCPISRDELMQKLLDRGIVTRKGVMTIHRDLPYRSEYSEIRLPVSEDACDRSILIPLYIPMSEKETDHVISNLRDLIT